MPFLNEGQEPVITIENLYDTADQKLFDVIAIDDKSDKPTNGLEKFPDLSLIKNSERLGVDGSRTKGVFYAETPYIFIIDGHMRFKGDHWLENIIDALEDEPWSAFCTKCLGLSEKNTDINQENLAYYLGANLFLYEYHGNAPEREKKYRNILEPKHSGSKEHKQRIYDVPCLLGANYGFSKSWFTRLRGFQGLRSWGSSEAYISLKYWLAGGRVRVIKDVEIGHIFRDKNPYKVDISHLIYNKLFIANTIFPPSITKDLVQFLGMNEMVAKANEMLKENESNIGKHRAYYKTVFTKSMYTVLENLGINYKWPEGVRP